MKIILVLILTLALQGCAFLDFFKRHEEPNIPPTEIVQLNKEVFVQCAFLKETLAISTFEEVLLAYGDVATAYGVCADKQATSIKLLKKFSNIKE